MDREEALERIRRAGAPWDVVVVGGGASGLGVAVDAAARGYRALLLEARDFGSGTSSRSTKLIHGGVRYLRQGHLGLVRTALAERASLWRNAPRLVDECTFVVPAYGARDLAVLRLGLGVYDLLAGGAVRSRVRARGAADTRALVPGVREAGLRGSVTYGDGRFDDARLAIALARTAWREGATVVNHMEVTGLSGRAGEARVRMRDREGGAELEVAARVVVNAAGPFGDGVRRLADPSAPPRLAPSRGTHLVLDRRAYPGEAALLVPDVGGGRVVFLVPWRQRVLLGTTDVAVDGAEVDAEPRATRAEADELLALAGRALEEAPRPEDVRSVFAGLRPLVLRHGGSAGLPRDHEVRRETPWLLTLSGGKWTSYRRMAEEAVDRAAEAAGLSRRACRTADLPLDETGAPEGGVRIVPGADVRDVEITHAVREEMARTVEDVLSRRTHALVHDAAAARAAAPEVGARMARLLGRDAAWEAEQVRAFDRLAAGRQFAGLR